MVIPMATLQIEHAITDLTTWKGAFDRFEDRRQQSGVVAQRIGHLVEDDHYLVIELDFATVSEAENFRSFLEEQVWRSQASSPGLSGSTKTRIFVPADFTSRRQTDDHVSAEDDHAHRQQAYVSTDEDADYRQEEGGEA